MTVPVLTFFNNKGGVGKTSLAYHLAWMFSELNIKILAADIDPQSNLTAMFLDEERLLKIWNTPVEKPTTLFRCLLPLAMGTGDIFNIEPEQITQNLVLLPAELNLLTMDAMLLEEWPKCLSDKYGDRPFRCTTAFWAVMQEAAERIKADLILVDTGPGISAINRAALVASDFVLIPLRADFFTVQALRNVGITLDDWRQQWHRRLANWKLTAFPLPNGAMRPIGYVVQSPAALHSRMTKSEVSWSNRVPDAYYTNILGQSADNPPTIEQDPECLAQIKHYHSLILLAQEARKPVFLLKPADGAIGSHALSAQDAYGHFQALAEKILRRIGL
jgi:cellulose biosynthesis protein BcsQ